MLPRDARLQVWNYVLSNEVTQGTSFIVTDPEGALYAVFGETKEITSLPRRGAESFFAYLNAYYGITEHEGLATFIYDSLRSHCIHHGARVSLRRFSAFSTTAFQAYLSGYDGKLWRCDGDRVEHLANGEDGVFFADDDGGEACEADVGQHGILLERLTSLNFADVGLGGMTPEHQQRALIVWLFALAFPDIMPTKPVLLLEGTQGSGKTSAIQLIQLALQGRVKSKRLQKNKEDDFGVLLMRSPIALFDNTDSYIDWAADAICAYATQGEFSARKLYTDNEEMTLKPHAFIALATKNPASFRREDVADRMMILRLERRAQFVSFRTLETQIRAERTKLLGEYIWYVNKIVASIRRYAHERIEEMSRMADFATFARAVADVFSWPEGAVDDLMAALQSERDAFINEEDPLVELLHKWITYTPRVGERAGRSSIGRTINVQTLFTELEVLAQADGIVWYKSPRMLAQKIRSPHVEREFTVKILPQDGHRVYRIWRKGDPVLEVVDENYGANLVADE